MNLDSTLQHGPHAGDGVETGINPKSPRRIRYLPTVRNAGVLDVKNTSARRMLAEPKKQRRGWRSVDHLRSIRGSRETIPVPSLRLRLGDFRPRPGDRRHGAWPDQAPRQVDAREIKALPVADLLADDCLLVLWIATKPAAPMGHSTARLRGRQ